MAPLAYARLTKEIIGAFYAVYGDFGYGFLENAYKNALAVEIGARSLHVRREVPIELQYRGISVGAYRMDMLVAGTVVVEVKTQKTITSGDERQLLNYLKVSRHPVGLLFNFGPTPTFLRRVGA